MKTNLHTIGRAAMLYNWHTSPTALRSDREHERHRKAARKVRRWLETKACEGIHWHESDNGKIHASN